MDCASPPGYRRYSVTGRPGQVPGSPGSEALPAYTRRNTLAPTTRRASPTSNSTEHSFLLLEGKNPWITLKLRSSAKSSKSLPTFFEKENINGTIELDADQASSPQSISVVITGKVVAGFASDDEFEFLNIVTPIWSKSGSSQSRSSATPSPPGGSSKLRGKCSWPISIPLPKEVELRSSRFRLPETFTDKNILASVQYQITLKVARGMLKADSKISTLFGYVPSTRPESPSHLRQLAYQEFSPIPSPAVDPSGWKTLPAVKVRGALFHSQKVEAKCILSLAKPLAYTRGSVIPCHMTVDSCETQLLDLLCSTSAIPLTLQRRVRYFNKPSAAQLHGVGWTEKLSEVGTVNWWPAPMDSGNLYVRHLEGEIRLAKDLKPSTEVGHFTVSYHVILWPFDVAGFTAAKAEPLLAEQVEIATQYAHGPRPHTYSPPSYNTPRSYGRTAALPENHDNIGPRMPFFN